jgi:hypothetical protein
MANDNLRSGPRGSSKQAAEFGFQEYTFQIDSSAAIAYTLPLPYGTTVAVVNCEAFAMTDMTVKDGNDATLLVGRTSDPDAFGLFDATATQTAGDILTKTNGAAASNPYAAADLIDADTDILLTFTINSGSGTNAGAIGVRILVEAVSGGLFKD